MNSAPRGSPVLPRFPRNVMICTVASNTAARRTVPAITQFLLWYTETSPRRTVSTRVRKESIELFSEKYRHGCYVSRRRQRKARTRDLVLPAWMFTDAAKIQAVMAGRAAAVIKVLCDGRDR